MSLYVLLSSFLNQQEFLLILLLNNLKKINDFNALEKQLDLSLKSQMPKGFKKRGKRTECLAIVAALGDESEELTVDVRCRNPDCREEMELELMREDLSNF